MESKMLIKGLSELWNTQFPIKAKILTTAHTFLLLSSPTSLNQFLKHLILWRSGFLKISGYKETMSINPLNESISFFCLFLIHNIFLKRKRAEVVPQTSLPVKVLCSTHRFNTSLLCKSYFLYKGPMLWNSVTFLKYLHKYSARHTFCIHGTH